MMAVKVESSTAPAAVSFAFLARGCFSWVIKSVSSSILVLRASAVVTIPIAMVMIHHSHVCSWQ